jgi:molecular chaperone GrpE
MGHEEETLTDELTGTAVDGGGTQAPADAKRVETRLRNEIKALRRELHEALDQGGTGKGSGANAEALQEAGDRYLRLAAEMENLRKRHRLDQAERLQYGNAELITRLLPLLDNFHRALDHAENIDEQFLNGMNMIVRQFEDILASQGVVPIEAEGQKFDPSVHQAVMSEPSPAHEDGDVIAELQRGYKMHERVLRPSLVKVAQNT